MNEVDRSVGPNEADMIQEVIPAPGSRTYI